MNTTSAHSHIGIRHAIAAALFLLMALSTAAAPKAIITKSGNTRTVKVTALPANVAEFSALRNQIGTSPEGVVALQVLALGMYSEYGQSVGEECLDMINTATGLTAHARGRLREWFVKGTNNPRPYQAASYMVGATADNGYNPSRPLTMVVTIGSTQRTSDGELITVRLRCQGYDSSKDIRITVKRPDGDRFCYINANGSMYMKVREIKKGTTYKGLR
ncbi:MAG: DUF6935 domain-containing protein [Candidatus Limisoma sp.]